MKPFSQIGKQLEVCNCPKKKQYFKARMSSKRITAPMKLIFHFEKNNSRYGVLYVPQGAILGLVLLRMRCQVLSGLERVGDSTAMGLLQEIEGKGSSAPAPCLAHSKIFSMGS